jgi:hypothetical protein
MSKFSHVNYQTQSRERPRVKVAVAPREPRFPYIPAVALLGSLGAAIASVSIALGVS